jgi:hypothetical protein
LIKKIIILFIFTISLFGGVIKSPIVTLNEDASVATIKINKVDVGVSGFVVHKLDDDITTILKNVVVTSFDKESSTATLSLFEFEELKQNSLPSGHWKVEVGDTVVLAFGYTRALLIAPSEEIYYRVTKATDQLQWIHPDLFAMVLSFNGHPTPLKEDFYKMSVGGSIGLVFFYLDQNLYTVDARSLKVLNISPAPLKQDELKLPFYSRVEEIDANWFGEGSDELTEYEPYYFGLLLKSNPDNAELKAMYDKYNNKR